LHLGVAWLPALFVGMAMLFIALMPLSEARMVVIRRRLAARDRRLAELVKATTESDSALVGQLACKLV